jgi:lipopolysaccharide/colanic/teichoic acid biosynthesis glycosyltransferase
MTPAQTSAVRLSQAYDTQRLVESDQAWLHVVTDPRERVFSWRYRYAKRSLDLIGSLVLICLFAVPGFLIAIAILLTSAGPLFYREERIGRNGVPFRIWKFRTMQPGSAHLLSVEHRSSCKNSLYGRIDKGRNDPRVTKIGRLLRQWSLDEIPQIFNILAGEMSLVGPRPIIHAEAAEYGKRLRFYLMVTPGLSGLWQVSGRSTVDYPERTRLDATYVQRWNLMADVQILLRTIPAVLGRVGAW